MIKDTDSRYIALKSHFRWGRLPEEDIRDLASQCHVYQFNTSDVVFYPEEPVTGSILVLEGCLEACGKDHESVYYGPGETLFPAALAGLYRAPSFVIGKTKGHYLVFPSGVFRYWASKNRPWISILSAAKSEDEDPWSSDWNFNWIPEKIPLKRFSKILEVQEKVQKVVKGAPLFLVLRCLIPGAIFILGLAYAWLILARFAPGAGTYILVTLPLIFAAAGLGSILFLYYEYRHNILLITDRAVISRTLSLTKRISGLQKVPLSRIKEIKTLKSNWLNSLFKFCDILIISNGDEIKISGILDKDHVADDIRGILAQVKATSKNKQFIHESLDSFFGEISRPERVITGKGYREVTLKTVNQFTFHRHFWKLIRPLSPWVGIVCGIILLYCLGLNLWSQYWTNWFLICLAGALFPLGKILWILVDWFNDKLILKQDKIILLHKKPLWFGQTVQEGNIQQIQQIGLRKESFVALLLDFGDLVIHLGTQEPLVLDNLSHPEWIQAKIFQFRDEMLQRDSEKSAQERFDEMAEFLKAYNEGRQQGFYNQDDGNN